MSKEQKSGEALALSPEGAELAVGTERRTLNPVTAVQRFLDRRNERRESTVEELTQAVTHKLLTGITEKGMVSLFRDKETGAPTTEIYSGFFKSAAIPDLRVTVWRNHTETEDRATHERFFGDKPERLYLQASEGSMTDKSTRSVIVTNRWGNAPDDFEFIYLRSWVDEARNQYEERSPAEKIAFLKQLLEVEFDEGAMASKFGAPYEPGATWSNTRPDDTTIHNAYWVRDIRHQLPALMPGTPELAGQPMQVIDPAHKLLV